MSNPDDMLFSERLSALIGNESVASFARKCGIGDSLVRKYLEGAEPGLEKVHRIWMATKCSLVWLAAGEGDPYPSAHLARDQRATYSVEVEDIVRIRFFDARASAGLGIENTDATVSRFNYFRREWWQREIGLPAEECFSLEISGTSMLPVLSENHVPIFHQEDEAIIDSIYVFRQDGEVFVKNIDRVPGRGLIARSEDASAGTWQINPKDSQQDFKIIGRLVFKQLGERI
jgi:phage repressor protein C with HTH and peptisase S24 domain